MQRLADDMQRYRSLRSSTAAVMWTAYVAHAALTGGTLAMQWAPLPIRPAVARVAGAALIVGGSGLCVAGVCRFGGVGELAGTRNQSLLTTGSYGHSRNPQYLGYLIALAGAAVGRRSGSALASTGALAVIYAAWIPVEESHLTELYGHHYTDYTHRTRRWWGRRN